MVNIEKPDGAVVQFGGQTAIKLTEALMKMGVPILGTSAENVDAAEDRELFDEILEAVPDPETQGTYRIYRRGGEARRPTSWAIRFWFVLPMYWADRACRSPSTMRMWKNSSASSTGIAQEHPILVDKYLAGKGDRGRRCLRRGGYPDPRYHGAHRARRYPFRRQYLRLSGTEPQ